MDIEKLMMLIDKVSQSNLTQFQMEEGNLKISMKTDKAAKGAPVVVEPSVLPQAPQKAETVQADVSVPEGQTVKSPLVGTFYAAAGPQEAPFVSVGDTVKKGQVLAIVEAMKLMNEIESEYDGIVKEILVENEQMVEYGQPLFIIQ